MGLFDFFKNNKKDKIDLNYELFKQRLLEKIKAEEDYKKTIKYEFVEKLINKLENNPEYFTALWLNQDKVSKSIMSIDKKFQIMNNGEIISPVSNIFLLKEQQEKIVHLVTKIIQRDEEFIINKCLKFL